MDHREALLESLQDEATAGRPPVLSLSARGWQHVALVASFALVIAGVALLPFAIRSMLTALGGQDDALYNLQTGQELKLGQDVDPDASEYLNVAAVSLDESAGAITLAVSGNRTCPETCPTVRLTFLALDNDVSRRRGLSPFASVTLGPTDSMYSQTVELPVRGTTVRYPFDTYELWLGIANPPAEEDGGESPPARPPGSSFIATLQNQLPQLVMAPPVTVDPSRLQAQTASLTLNAVQILKFHRPDYLPFLTVALILLVAASSGLALLTQPIDTLVLGIGGLILAIWGVRSVLMPQSLPVVTAVDLALSGVILLLLLGLAARVALHLRQQTGVRVPWPRRRR